MRVSAIAAPERMAAKPAGGAAAAATEADIKAKLKYLVGKVRGLVLYFIKAKWRKWCSVLALCMCVCVCVCAHAQGRGEGQGRGDEREEGRPPAALRVLNQPTTHIHTHAHTHRHNMHTQ